MFKSDYRTYDNFITLLVYIDDMVMLCDNVIKIEKIK